jgi:hypothetical protein
VKPEINGKYECHIDAFAVGYNETTLDTEFEMAVNVQASPPSPEVQASPPSPRVLGEIAGKGKRRRRTKPHIRIQLVLYCT